MANHARMTRRVLLGLLLALALSSPALGVDIGQKKQAVDANIASLQSKLAVQQQQEAGLRSQIAGVTSRIRSLEAQVGDVSLRLETLQQDLALHNERLAKLNELFGL